MTQTKSPAQRLGFSILRDNWRGLTDQLDFSN